MALALMPGVIQEAWKESGCWPVDVTKVLNGSNFPSLNLPLPRESPPKKRKRAGFRISNRLLTVDSAISEIKHGKSSK